MNLGEIVSCVGNHRLNGFPIRSWFHSALFCYRAVHLRCWILRKNSMQTHFHLDLNVQKLTHTRMPTRLKCPKISTVIGQFAASLTLEVNSSHAWDKYPFTAASRFFFFNIVYQKISNMPLDAHTSAHIFEKQVTSTANAVKFLFLLYCYLV